MDKELSLLDLAFSTAMLVMGTMLVTFAVDCEAASNAIKAVSILSGGTLMIISMLTLD